MANLIKHEDACSALAECNTMSDLKTWNDRAKEILKIANAKQDIRALEDVLKIVTQINIRMKQLLVIQGELIQEMTNEI